jgi:hypothetical protein
VARLESVIAEHRSDVVVLDSVSKVFGGADEKDNTALAGCYRELLRLRNAYGCAFIRLHQTTKAAWRDTSEGERMGMVRGGGEHAAAVDVILWLEKKGRGRELSLLERREPDGHERPPLMLFAETPEGAEGPLLLEYRQLEEVGAPAARSVDEATDLQLAHLNRHGSTRTAELDYVVAAAEVRTTVHRDHPDR